jgi:hypothetical protein
MRPEKRSAEKWDIIDRGLFAANFDVITLYNLRRDQLQRWQIRHIDSRQLDVQIIGIDPDVSVARLFGRKVNDRLVIAPINEGGCWNKFKQTGVAGSRYQALPVVLGVLVWRAICV